MTLRLSNTTTVHPSLNIITKAVRTWVVHVIKTREESSSVTPLCDWGKFLTLFKPQDFVIETTVRLLKGYCEDSMRARKCHRL